MINTALASTAYEIGAKIGYTDSTFLTKVKTYLNDRYDDALMRSGATMWTMASMAALGDGDVPTLGLGKVIKAGATADAYEDKKQFSKSAKFEQKYEVALANFIISGDYNRFLASFGRYAYHV